MPTALKEPLLSESRVRSSIFTRAAALIRGRWIGMFLISALVITPCLWHTYIGSGDLCSHVYNAWIVHLINNGNVSGLWVARQWDNVLFDLILSGLGNVFDWNVAGKIATSGAVLIFFWGAFALVWAVSRRLPWFSVPCLAMFSYGWTFGMGFMNYYIAVGMAFFGLAFVVICRNWSLILAAALLPLIWLAHPLGVILLFVAASYIIVAPRISIRQRACLFGACVLTLFAISFFLRIHYRSTAIWNDDPGVVHDGIDQLLLFGPRYLLPARLFLAFASICLALDLVKVCREPRWWSPYLLPLELYIFALLSSLLFPSFIDIWRLQEIGFKSIGFLTERLTSASAVFLCCLLGTMKPQRWHLAGFCFISIIFFLFYYRDTATLSDMEADVRRCLNTIPPGQRVIGTIHPFKGARVSVHGILDAACVGRCFDYDNYEPASQQFRVRAVPGNPFVLTNFADCQAAATGKYIVRVADEPLYQIEQGSSNSETMSIRLLSVGKTNGCMPFRY